MPVHRAWAFVPAQESALLGPVSVVAWGSVRRPLEEGTAAAAGGGKWPRAQGRLLAIVLGKQERARLSR